MGYSHRTVDRIASRHQPACSLVRQITVPADVEEADYHHFSQTLRVSLYKMINSLQLFSRNLINGFLVAEKTFKKLTALSTVHPSITFIAVSHSSASATEKWVTAVGGAQNLEVIVDEERELYAQWGLGTSGVWHVLNPWSLWNVYRLGKQEGIWNRPTESGNRWQTSGSWAVNTDGLVRWGGVANSADEIPDFNEALEALKIQG